jgi:hypothetical protein
MRQARDVAVRCDIRLVRLLLGMTWFLRIAPSVADDLGADQPRPVPPVYVTENHGLMASFPPGLTYCPLPKDWVGSDHGTEVYLVPPAGCGASTSYWSSDRSPGSRVPTIGLYYAYNVVEISPGSGRYSPPRTPREALQIYCREPHAPVPAGIQLLGVVAAGCLIEDRRSVEVRVVGLYSVDRAMQEVADHVLVVSLMTTRDRLRDDLGVFKVIAGDIRVCTPDWAKEVKGRSPCPLGVGWW